MKITSADGVNGILIYVHVANTYVFRVYDHPNNTFKDYDLLHSDLSITINDSDASFYEQGERMSLDHSPETLGIEVPQQ